MRAWIKYGYYICTQTGDERKAGTLFTHLHPESTGHIPQETTTTTSRRLRSEDTAFGLK